MRTSNTVSQATSLRIAGPVCDSTLDEIRAIPLADVAGAVTSLRRVGARFIGLCPFHKEKHPSFSISIEKNLFYCHACTAGGDTIAFVMRFERCDFKSAVTVLAQRFGIWIEHGVIDPKRLALHEELRRIDQRIAQILKDEQVRIGDELARLRKIVTTHTLETLPSNIFDDLRRMDARYILAVLASDDERLEFLSSSIERQEQRINEVFNDGYFSQWEIPMQ